MPFKCYLKGDDYFGSSPLQTYMGISLTEYRMNDFQVTMHRIILLDTFIKQNNNKTEERIGSLTEEKDAIKVNKESSDVFKCARFIIEYAFMEWSPLHHLIHNSLVIKVSQGSFYARFD